VDIIAPSPEYYPDFNKLRLTLGDPKNRVNWRSKQNLDFAFLMMYCQPKGYFYVQIEDDIIVKPQFHTIMKNTALQRIANGQEWFILDFGELGFIGKSYDSNKVLSHYSSTVLIFIQEKCLDVRIYRH